MQADFTFVCHTEDPTGIHPDIQIIPLDLSLDLEVWWWKLVLFQKPTDEVNIFFDLDNVIQKDITHYKDFAEQDKLMMIKAYWKPWLEDIPPIVKGQFDMNLNSSVMVWKGDLTDIWNTFYDNIDYWLFKYRGIDSYLNFDHAEKLNFFPRGEIYSRAYGVDENDYWYTPGSHGPEKHYYSEEHNICIFNGWKRRRWADRETEKFILDNEGYKGYEHYWE